MDDHITGLIASLRERGDTLSVEAADTLASTVATHRPSQSHFRRSAGGFWLSTSIILTLYVIGILVLVMFYAQA